MIIAHNMLAANANRMLKMNNKSKQKSSEKLGSGYKLNRAADNAAGLTISEGMRAQIRGLNRGSDNIQDGIGLVQIADGALQEVNTMLHRMSEISVQAANDTNCYEDRKALQEEINHLASEITRIGKSTEYNTMPLFDDMYHTDDNDKITNLVSSPAAKSGHLTEAIQVGSKWCPSASIDFTNIDATNISKLNEQGFAFTCSMGCSETFDFKFVTDGRPSTATNLSGKVAHHYQIDISACTSGAEVVDAIYNYVQSNPPINNSPSSENMLPGALNVSHSNNMIKSADGNGIVIYSNCHALSTESAAKAYFANSNSRYGAIDCSEITSIITEDIINEINIQCGGGEGDDIVLKTHRMNATLLGVDSLSMFTHESASKAISKIQEASEKISKQRSELGAAQNRLEYAMRNNDNTAENLSSAESRIRDTDMAYEMVRFSISSVLEEAGLAMVAQANTSRQGILSLLRG